jgi:sec-independent protein translocase protein TatC
VSLLPQRLRRARKFERAADGSMTLMEHLYELRSRLFKACLGIVAGVAGGLWLANPVLNLLYEPYCTVSRDLAAKAHNGQVPADFRCQLVALGATDPLLLNLKIALWVGLIIAAPIWLYQLWAFVAPGLHRHERRWAYLFAGIAAPLFALGAVLAYYVIAIGLAFLLKFTGSNVTAQLEITRYVDFVTGLMLLFGVAFEFPLAVMLLNVAGVLSARRLLSWWRIAVFLFFVFAAVATPTGDPFGMTFLALAMSVLYFGAVGFAFFNDRRRARRRAEALAALPPDDEASPLDYEPWPVDALEPVDAVDPVAPPEPVPAPRPLQRRFDDTT